MSSISFELIGDGYQAFDAVFIDADLVLFGKDIFDLLLPTELTFAILLEQACELAVFPPEPSVHVGTYQYKASLLFTKE